MELFKTCVQNKWGTAFSCFSSLINHVELMLYYKKCDFKGIGKQMKYEYGYEIRMCVQYCTPNVMIQKICVQSKQKAGF